MASNSHGPAPEVHSLAALSTEGVNPATTAIDRMSPLEIVQAMNAEDAKVAEAVKQTLPVIAQAIDAIATSMRAGGRLLYVGAGTSGRLGALDAAECPPTFNLPHEKVVAIVAGGPTALGRAAEDAEDSAEAGRADLAHYTPGKQDVVVGIAASGRTPYVLGAMAYAREQGALTVGIACNPNSPLAEAVTLMIAPLVGPEAVTGSTRLKAGTAQKMVLNMLSTGAMILLGKTYGNLMVDVQATNLKLHQRALKIVQVAADLDRESAEKLLQEAGGETKTAIVMGRLGVTAEEARARLATHDYALSAALEGAS